MLIAHLSLEVSRCCKTLKGAHMGAPSVREGKLWSAAMWHRTLGPLLNQPLHMK
jgi:hypothetical protein